MPSASDVAKDYAAALAAAREASRVEGCRETILTIIALLERLLQQHTGNAPTTRSAPRDAKAPATKAQKAVKAVKAPAKRTRRPSHMELPVKDMSFNGRRFSPRTLGTFQNPNVNITVLNDFRRYTADQLMSLHYFTENSLKIVEHELRIRGLRLPAEEK